MQTIEPTEARVGISIAGIFLLFMSTAMFFCLGCEQRTSVGWVNKEEPDETTGVAEQIEDLEFLVMEWQKETKKYRDLYEEFKNKPVDLATLPFHVGDEVSWKLWPDCPPMIISFYDEDLGVYKVRYYDPKRNLECSRFLPGVELTKEKP